MKENESTNYRKRRSPTNYKLGEKDNELIKEALYKFTPIYVIAKKIGCDYNTLRKYIKANKELNQCREDAEANMVEVAKGQLMKRVIKGNVNSIMFLLERLDKKHFGRYTAIENIGDLPEIKIGVFKDTPDPVSPDEVGADAASILQNAADLAHQRAVQEEMGELDDNDAPDGADD